MAARDARHAIIAFRESEKSGGTGAKAIHESVANGNFKKMWGVRGRAGWKTRLEV